jgi:hypothetical protein
MTKPNMRLVREWAKKYNINEPIKESELKNKKLKIKVDGKWIHFGNPEYEDYSTHRDKVRQDSYCKRAGAIQYKTGGLAGNDPNSPNYYAMRLLWDCTPKGG